MADVSQEKFLQAYGNFLVQAWANPQVKKKFKDEPGKVLKEFGLDPENAKIKILAPGTPNSLSIQNPTAESQVRLWNEGRKKGTIEFYFPEEAPADLATQELSDQELEAIAGGVSVSCCCCSPCCCC